MTDKINLGLNDQTTLKRQDVDPTNEIILNETENYDFESLYLSDIPLSISKLSSSSNFGIFNQSISNDSLQKSKSNLEPPKVNTSPHFFQLSNELESHKVALKEPSKLMLILTSKHIHQLKPKANKVQILDLISHYNSKLSKSFNFTCTPADFNSKNFISCTTQGLIFLFFLLFFLVFFQTTYWVFFVYSLKWYTQSRRRKLFFFNSQTKTDSRCKKQYFF